ncbi:MAG: cellulase family glycosylhydrolase [Pirellulales bacterium]|nr:cellulase family glycosylhydrolase [Pirellulales bacterium]
MMKYDQVKILVCFLAVLVMAATVQASEKPKTISAKSKAVRNKIDLHSPSGCSHIYGFNYQPSWGYNGVTVWGEKFDAKRYRKELTIGKKHFPKMNAVRIWLSWSAYRKNPERAIRQFQQAVDICGDLDLLVMPIIFNRWHGNPSWDRVKNREILSDFEPTFAPFIRDLVTPTKGDKRILAWDLCNEPFFFHRPPGKDETPLPKETREAVELKWLTNIHRVVKACDPDALICIGNMNGLNHIESTAPLQDILTVHFYYPIFKFPYKKHPPDMKDSGLKIERVEKTIEIAKRHKKPLLCTECCWGSQYDDDRANFIVRKNLEMLTKYKIGFFPHALWTSGVADLHKYKEGLYMPFILEDGSIRPGHEIYNEFTK